MFFGCPWLNLGLSAICSQVVTTTSAIFFASSRPSEAPDFEWRNTFYDASKGLRVSQSRFSIVLVGVSALLRRPLVSRLRPAGFTARGSGGFRRSGWPLRFGLPLGGLAFGLTASAFRHAPLRSCRSAGWFFRLLLRRFRSVVGLRVHCFRFSARTALELPSSGWFLRLPFRSCRSASWPSGFCFRFSACAASEWPLGEFVLPPSVSEIALGGLAFGLTASAFRHAPLRSGRWADWPSGFRFGVASAGWFFRWAGWSSGSLLPLFGLHRFGVAAGRVRSSAFRFGVAVLRVGLRAHCFRFSACTTSGLPLGGLVFTPSVSEIALGGLAFGLTASAFRHAPLRGCPRRADSSTFRFGDCPRRVGLRAHGFRFSACAASEIAVRRVGLRAHCFRFSARADPHRRTAEARTDGAQRHDTCFTSKHLSQHVNLPHRTP